MSLIGLKALMQENDELYYKGGPFDRSNPRSLINIAPSEVVDILEERMPIKYLYMSEEELDDEFNPNREVQKIRLAFWKEYECAQSELRHMTLSHISLQLGAPSIYLVRVLKDVTKLACILCPPRSYELFLEEGLMSGMKRLREIIDMPMYTDEGKPDHKAMEVVLKAVAFLDMRKHGGIVQKQLQVTMTKNSQQKLVETASLEEIDAKIRELENKQSLSFARNAVGEQNALGVEIETTDKVINALEKEFSGK